MTMRETIPERQQVSSVPLFPSNFCRSIHYNGRANCGVCFWWQGAQRRASVSHCATEFVLSPKWCWRSWPVSWSNMVGLCSALIKPCPQSPKGPTLPTSWRSPTLLGVTWVIGRAQPHHQMWRLLSICSWRNRTAESVVFLIVTVRVPFLSPNPQDVDCILTAIGFPSASMIQDFWFDI